MPPLIVTEAEVAAAFVQFEEALLSLGGVSGAGVGGKGGAGEMKGEEEMGFAAQMVAGLKKMLSLA